MEPDTYKGDGRNLFCLSKGSEVYLYFMTPAWKDHTYLYVGPKTGGTWRYDVEIYDAWAGRKERSATWGCGMATGLKLPPHAAIVLRRKRGR